MNPQGNFTGNTYGYPYQQNGNGIGFDYSSQFSNQGNYSHSNFAPTDQSTRQPFIIGDCPIGPLAQGPFKR